MSKLSEIINNSNVSWTGLTTTATLTLTVVGWVAKSQTLTVAGVTATSTNLIAIDSITMGDRWGTAKIYAISQGTDSIVFNCDVTPTDPIEFKVVIIT